METVGRALLFITAAPALESGELESDRFEQGVVTACESIRERLGPGATVRAGIRLADDPLAAIVRERNVRPTDAVVEVSVPDPAGIDELARSVGGFARVAGDAIDPVASLAVCGPCHLLAGGTGPVMLASTARRDSRVTRNEFSDWWLHRHGPMSIELVPSLGYQQVHADPAASRVIAEAAGVIASDNDLGETAYFPSVEAFTGRMADPVIGKQLMDDEVGHVDHSSILAMMGRVVLDSTGGQ